MKFTNSLDLGKSSRELPLTIARAADDSLNETRSIDKDILWITGISLGGDCYASSCKKSLKVLSLTPSKIFMLQKT